MLIHIKQFGPAPSDDALWEKLTNGRTTHLPFDNQSNMIRGYSVRGQPSRERALTASGIITDFTNALEEHTATMHVLIQSPQQTRDDELIKQEGLPVYYIDYNSVNLKVTQNVQSIRWIDPSNPRALTGKTFIKEKSDPFDPHNKLRMERILRLQKQDALLLTGFFATWCLKYGHETALLKGFDTIVDPELIYTPSFFQVGTRAKTSVLMQKCTMLTEPGQTRELLARQTKKNRL